MGKRSFKISGLAALALANHFSCRRDHFNDKQIWIIANLLHDACPQIENFEFSRVIMRDDLTDLSFYDKCAKDFIELADVIKNHNKKVKRLFNSERMCFSEEEIIALSQFCYDQNPRFSHSRWSDYIDGKCTANGRYFTDKELAAKGKK